MNEQSINHREEASHDTFRSRKAARSDYFWRFIYGWKLRPCSACNGSGYYDHNGHPQCGACEGTAHERYRGPKSVARETGGSEERAVRIST